MILRSSIDRLIDLHGIRWIEEETRIVAHSQDIQQRFVECSSVRWNLINATLLPFIPSIEQTCHLQERSELSWKWAVMRPGLKKYIYPEEEHYEGSGRASKSTANQGPYWCQLTSMGRILDPSTPQLIDSSTDGHTRIRSRNEVTRIIFMLCFNGDGVDQNRS